MANETRPDLAPVIAEVRQGFYARTKEMMAECAANLDFWDMRNSRHLERREGESQRDYERRPKQYSRMTRRAIDRLTSMLYSPGPQRMLEGDDGGLLETIYEQNNIDALMGEADAQATLNGVCAVMAAATGKPDDPVRLWLYGRQEFVPYFASDDPRKPWCVVTYTIQEKGVQWRRQAEIWTADVHQVWVSKWIDPPHFAATVEGTTIDRMEVDEPNPYGVLPFAFVFNRLPVSKFDGLGIGTALRETNEEIDRMLSDLAEALTVFNVPKIVGTNIAPSFRWRDRVDGVIVLPAANTDPDQPPPDLRFIQATLDVAQTWEHVRNLANATFEDLNLPVAMKADANWDASGIAIVLKEEEPVARYTRKRQRLFEAIEDELKTVVLSVASNYYGVPVDPETPLVLQWPVPAPSMPTPETDQTLQTGLDLGVESVVTVCMKRFGMTRDQAIKHLQQVKQDQAEFGPPQVDPMTGLPIDPNTGLPMEEPTDGEETDDEAPEAETEDGEE